MPAYSKLDNTLATKLVSVYPNNHEKGLPSHLAHVLLYEAETGSLKAVSIEVCKYNKSFHLRRLKTSFFKLLFLVNKKVKDKTNI